MSKTTNHPKNLFHLLLVLLIAMVSVAEASLTSTVGEWKLKEVWKENDAEPLSITRDGRSYIMKIQPENPENDSSSLRLTIKVGNAMSSSIEILEEDETSNQQTIKIGFVMSTRMMPGSEEKQQLESYLSNNLPKMNSMKIDDGEHLVLSSETGARIVLEVSEDEEE